LQGQGYTEDGEALNGEVRLTFWLEKGDEAKLQELRVALLKLKSDELYGVYGDGADFGRLWLDTETVTDDWKDKYKESFHEFSPCEGVVVAPPWENVGRINGADGNKDFDCGGGNKDFDGAGRNKDFDGADEPLRIVIDPGMAFGTGSHETTAMCLSKLKSLIKHGDTMLDAGTGSGILSIAAALLGASCVHAVEVDKDAAESAARNIETNSVQETVELIVGDVAETGTLPVDMLYDLITANLSCSLLESLFPVFKRTLKEDGAMILSGLLDAQEDRAFEALENAGLWAAEVVKDGEWLMIEVRK